MFKIYLKNLIVKTNFNEVFMNNSSSSKKTNFNQVFMNNSSSSYDYYYYYKIER